MVKTPAYKRGTYAKNHKNHCDWCGKEIVGNKKRQYCQPTDKTKSQCQILAAAARRKEKGSKMTPAFKKLATYMSYIANMQQYQSWTGDFVKKEYFTAIEKAKKAFSEEKINFAELTQDELKVLRFMDFDENNKNLIPLWLFRILPNDTKVKCFDGEETTIEKADDDVRFGCTAYMLILEKQNEKTL